MPWLMKAEPDSRVVKGKDVKFSVDDFEALGVSPWDGVRNHEAKKIMKEKMKVGDQVLFYHSNCKTPGVFATAEVAKEGYPDYTAWDEKHPYYDAKTKKNAPTWYMVDVKFVERLAHPPTLALIKFLAGLSAVDLPEEVAYIGLDGLKAIGAMQLVNRGRLSVQPVEQKAYDTILLLGAKGGWDSLIPSGSKTKQNATTTTKADLDPKPELAGKKNGAKRRKSEPDDETLDTLKSEHEAEVDGNGSGVSDAADKKVTTPPSRKYAGSQAKPTKKSAANHIGEPIQTTKSAPKPKPKSKSDTERKPTSKDDPRLLSADQEGMRRSKRLRT